MQKRHAIRLDTQGRPISGATIVVKDYPSATVATIYSDDGVTEIDGATLVTDSKGYFEYYAANGHYSEVTTTATETTTLNDILLDDSLTSNQQFVVATGTGDAMVIGAFAIGYTLADGDEVRVRAPSANTVTNPTIDLPSVGVLTIYKHGGLALDVGDIRGAGHEIHIRYRTSPARVELTHPDSFMQSGTGAGARTMQSKARDIVSVKDFKNDDGTSVVGDGVQDDTTGMDACVAAVDAYTKNGAIYIPAGQYKRTAFWGIPYGISVYGEGGTVSEIVCYACDGIRFTSTSYSIGSMFFKDFGVTGASGTNFAAMTSLTSATTQDGIHINRCRIFNFNEGIVLRQNWTTHITENKIENVRTAIRLGAGTNIILRVRDNDMSLGTAAALGSADIIGIDIASGILENISVTGNQISGFGVCVRINTATFVNILDNDMLGTQYGVEFTAVQNILNINDNYIELTGVSSTAGIMGHGIGAAYASMINIERNNFIASSLGAAVADGIRLNDAANTNQFNGNILRNFFQGLTGYDIRLYSPGKLNVENNRCVSTGTTNSIFVGGVIAPPVFVSKNWCYNDIDIDVAADLTSGKVILDQNTVNDTFNARVRLATVSFNPANLADGAGETTTVTVTGAALGDFVESVSFGADLQGITLTAYVSAADTVAVRFQNETGGAINLAEETIRVRVRRKDV